MPIRVAFADFHPKRVTKLKSFEFFLGTRFPLTAECSIISSFFAGAKLKIKHRDRSVAEGRDERAHLVGAPGGLARLL
jgi:hypothetical protein